MRFFYFLIFISFVLFSNFFFFKKESHDTMPHNLTKSEICASDSMIIVHYNGPKAQILWKNGKRSFYCEVREAFYEYLDNVRGKQILSFYVQDFSNIEWGSYIDKWIVASDAFYVIDSKKDGAMGLTYVPFSNYDFASKFLNLYGGKIVKFSDINSDILSSSSKLLKNRFIN
ncbi:MAG TPA: nitrous oxide reductase accessory protein NosL [Candidatus Azoamicus sp.]